MAANAIYSRSAASKICVIVDAVGGARWMPFWRFLRGIQKHVFFTVIGTPNAMTAHHFAPLENIQATHFVHRTQESLGFEHAYYSAEVIGSMSKRFLVFKGGPPHRFVGGAEPINRICSIGIAVALQGGVKQGILKESFWTHCWRLGLSYAHYFRFLDSQWI